MINMTRKLSQGTSSIFLSDGITPSTILTRTIHTVGQGAFYSEIFSARKKKLFTTVYDCGSNDREYLNTNIEKFGAADLVFISHFHNDHIIFKFLIMDQSIILQKVFTISTK